jgi:hypothetical protein
MLAIFRWMMVVVTLASLTLLGGDDAAGMGFEGFGPAGENIGRSPDWPKGVEDVLRHSSRVYWYDVNGSQSAYYDGDIGTVNELLDLFSKVDLNKHDVVLRPGRPSAKSFHESLTPYVVEFDVPGGIETHFRQRNAGSGLLARTPRMIVHIDAALAKHLGELKVPENVTLHASAVRIEDALAHVDDADFQSRYSAIVALGDVAEASPAARAAVERAAADENESIRVAGETARAKLAAAEKPAEVALRKRLAEFLDHHPQRARVLSAEELLEALREVDAKYLNGFTARGTRVEPVPTGPDKLVAWTVTMGSGRLVVDQRDVEDDDHPKVAGQFEYVNYIGPERMGSIHGNRLWVDGKLMDVKPMATFEPVGSTYDLLVGRFLWPLGRGFASQIDRITSVTTMADGLLKATAEGDRGAMKCRWELVIDPEADYLVRDAKAFRRDEKQPSYVVKTAGVLTGGGRSVAHTARWIEGEGGLPASIAVTNVFARADDELIERTEQRLDELPGLGE